MQLRTPLLILLLCACDDDAATGGDGPASVVDAGTTDVDAAPGGPDAGPAGPCPTRVWQAPEGASARTTRDFIQDESSLYLSIRDDVAARSTVWRVPKSGGDGELLVDDERAEMLHLDGDWLYFEQGSTPTLARVSKSGGDVEARFALPTSRMRGHDDYLYGAGGDHLIEVFKVDGAIRTLGSGTGWDAVDAVDGAAVYLRAQGSLIAISRGDGTSVAVLTEVEETGPVSADDMALYLNRTGHGLVRWTADLGSYGILDENGPEVALDDDHAFFLDGGEIHRIVKFGGPGHLIVAPSPAGEGHVAVDGERVYWSVDVAGRPEVWSAPKRGCD